MPQALYSRGILTGVDLPSPDLAARIKAAMALRGTDQDKLGALFKQDGLGQTDPGRIIRGKLDMQRAHRDAFCRHLRLPDTYFTAADPLEPPQTQLDRIELMLIELRAERFAAAAESRDPFLRGIAGADPSPPQELRPRGEIGRGDGTGEEDRRPGTPDG